MNTFCVGDSLLRSPEGSSVFPVEVCVRVSVLPIPTLHSLSKLASLMGSRQVGNPTQQCRTPASYGQSSHSRTSGCFWNPKANYSETIFNLSIPKSVLPTSLEITSNSTSEEQERGLLAASQSCPLSLWAPQCRDCIPLCNEHSASSGSGTHWIFLEETQSSEKDCHLQEVSQAWNQTPEVPLTIS